MSLSSDTSFSAAQSPAEVRIIRAKRGLIGIDFAELWRYRELFLQLSWRYILVRYKQTYLGIAWAVLQPLLTTIIFTVVFGQLGKFDSKGVAYPVMVLAALLPWQFFANALGDGSNSLVAAQNMVTKIYFPRFIIPASAILSGIVDFLISLALFFLVLWWYEVPVDPRMIFIPFFFFAAFVASTAMGLWFSALNVKYRDVRYVVPFIVRMGFFVSPVAFLSDLMILPRFGEKGLFWYNALNPLAGIMEGFRWCALGAKFEPYWPGFWAGMAFVAILLVSGAYYFRTTEKTFADVI